MIAEMMMAAVLVSGLPPIQKPFGDALFTREVRYVSRDDRVLKNRSRRRYEAMLRRRHGKI